MKMPVSYSYVIKSNGHFLFLIFFFFISVTCGERWVGDPGRNIVII